MPSHRIHDNCLRAGYVPCRTTNEMMLFELNTPYIFTSVGVDFQDNNEDVVEEHV